MIEEPEKAPPDAEHASELPPPSAQEDEPWGALPEQAPYDRFGSAATASVAAHDGLVARVKSAKARFAAGARTSVRSIRNGISKLRTKVKERQAIPKKETGPNLLERYRDAKDDVE